MRKVINKATKGIVVCSLLTTLPILANITEVSAKGNLESEFSSVINQYDIEDVIVENGVSISKSETIDLSQYPGWEMSNDDTVKIDENGILKPINEGTVYLSNEINEKVHIVEVYVYNNDVDKFSATPRATTVVRDHYKVFVDPGHGGTDPGAIGNDK